MAPASEQYVPLGIAGVTYRMSVGEVLVHLPDLDPSEWVKQDWMDDLSLAYKVIRIVRQFYPYLPIQQIRVQGLADF
jgi:hypothetical protein